MILLSACVVWDSGFHVMTVNKISRNRPEVISGFRIIQVLSHLDLQYHKKTGLVVRLEDDPSTQALSISHQCVLEWHENTIKNFGNSCNTGASSCCFQKCVEANPCLRIVALRTSEMLSAILEPWNSNEILDHNDVPISWPFLRFRLKESLLWQIRTHECHSTSFLRQE